MSLSRCCPIWLSLSWRLRAECDLCAGPGHSLLRAGGLRHRHAGLLLAVRQHGHGDQRMYSICLMAFTLKGIVGRVQDMAASTGCCPRPPAASSPARAPSTLLRPWSAWSTCASATTASASSSPVRCSSPSPRSSRSRPAASPPCWTSSPA